MNNISRLKKGYEILDNLLSYDQVNVIQRDIELANFAKNVGGIRNAEKKFSTIDALACSDELKRYAEYFLMGTPQLVRAILFNKTAKSNWSVPWHQDKTIAVSCCFEAADWGPWSIKDGIVHVQPPVDVLDRMVTFRIHLDNASKENGCLNVLPESHQLGILSRDAIVEYTRTCEAVSCEGSTGSALVMRPHILHSSNKAVMPSQRRVLHLEYSSYRLPAGVTWA